MGLFDIFKRKTKVDNKQLNEKMRVEKKLKSIDEVIDIIKNKEKRYFKEQDNNYDIERVKREYSFLPNDYIEFCSKCAFMEIGAGGVGAVTFQPNNMPPNVDMQEYLDGYGMGYKVEDWFFIADDGMGGEYAYSIKEKDGKIYYFDHEFPERLNTYESFTHLLNELID